MATGEAVLRKVPVMVTKGWQETDYVDHMVTLASMAPPMPPAAMYTKRPSIFVGRERADSRLDSRTALPFPRRMRAPLPPGNLSL
jgi:hypothetical protein